MESNKKFLKATLLREMLDRKKDLFGAFSATTTKSTKTDAWKAIHAKGQALGLVPISKDYTYTRDVLWQNIKKAAVKKRDNSRQTGSGGGPACKMTEVDQLVYSIIGSESAVLDGLPVTESMPLDEINVMEPTASITVPTTPEPVCVAAKTPEPSSGIAAKTPEPGSGVVRKIIKKTKSKPGSATGTNSLDNLRKLKLQLTIGYLKLKIKKLEKELNMETCDTALEPNAVVNFLEVEYLEDSDSD